MQAQEHTSDRIRPDRIGSNQQNLDWINNEIPAQSRHMKSLGHQLRLLSTFADVLQGKIRTRVSFNKILTNKICNLTAAQPALHTYFVFSLNKCSL